jgi:hypothetical protein
MRQQAGPGTEIKIKNPPMQRLILWNQYKTKDILSVFSLTPHSRHRVLFLPVIEIKTVKQDLGEFCDDRSAKNDVPSSSRPHRTKHCPWMDEFEYLLTRISPSPLEVLDGLLLVMG